MIGEVTIAKAMAEAAVKEVVKESTKAIIKDIGKVLENANDLLENVKTYDSAESVSNADSLLDLANDSFDGAENYLDDFSISDSADGIGPDKNDVFDKSEQLDETSDSGKSETIDDADDSVDAEDSGNDSDTQENNETEIIKCRNEDLAGKKHPETGVPFEKKQIEFGGKTFEVVVPKFDSLFDTKLPENMNESADREQFKECNAQLKQEVESNDELRNRFDKEQLEQIESGETPDGYTWHHDAEVGKMQLVDTEIHQKTGHTGGRSIWGGGTENR